MSNTIRDEKLPLILHPGSGLALVKPQGGRIVAEMVSGALALSRTAENASEALVPRFRIDEHEFCEPDYRQILIWTKALGIEPQTMIERLLTAPESRIGKVRRRFARRLGLAEPENTRDEEARTQFVGGRIVQLGWNIELLPLESFEWVDDLAIESIVFSVPEDHEPIERVMPLPLCKLRRLDCQEMGITKLDLSTVPLLAKLKCDHNNLTSLDLAAVPRLTELTCADNNLTSLDLANVPELRTLGCWNNHLTSLSLSAGPMLTLLWCHVNHLTTLDLSNIRSLKSLWCYNNELTDLDIRPLEQLETLSFDSDSTRLIQRPDQHF